MPEGFNPDAYLAVKSAPEAAAPAFDPDMYLKQTREAVPMNLPEAPPMPSEEEMRFGKVKMNPYESALLGGAQGLTAGFQDEIAATLQAGWDKVTSPFSTKKYSDLRQEHLEKNRYLLNEAARQNPKTAIASEVAGALASPLNKVTKSVEGAALLTRAAKASLAGATIAAGKSEANPFNSKNKASEFMSDVRLGALAGPLVEGTVGLIGKGSKALMPQALNTFADKAAKKIGAEEAGDYLGGLALGGIAGAVLDPSESKMESALKGMAVTTGLKYLRNQIPTSARNLAKLTSMSAPNQVLRLGQSLPYTPARNAAIQFGYSGAEE